MKSRLAVSGQALFLQWKILGSGLRFPALQKPLEEASRWVQCLPVESLWTWPPGIHSNTFGGNLLASAASLATLEFLEKEYTEKRVKELGSYMIRLLGELQESIPCIGDVRGLGLMIGVEIVKPDKSTDPILRDKILREAFKERILLLPCGDSVIRFSPPLVITVEEVDLGLEKFENALRRTVR